MVRIRLRRLGAKKQPAYRIVVADSRAPRDGRFIETIGHYNPRTEPPTVVVDEKRALYWLSQGAQPSGPVAAFFAKLGLPEKLAQLRAGTPIEALAAPAPSPEQPVVRPSREAPVAPAAVPAEADQVEVEAHEPTPSTVLGSEVEESAAPIEAADAGRGTMIGDLDLPQRVVKALESAGISSLEQLVELLAEGDQRLLDLPGIGQKALEEIRAQLADRGIALER